ncbi:hypothetical protein ACH4E8_34130 [Streptomyces sp. NPDC017979]|uniref:hypothetical protein n=1 Tax=Streptomyces sp. NPDC017979 TaxID=3365024 RepID=UPI00379BE5EE
MQDHQPTAIVLTAMPERPGHHLRWMRGSTFRSLWRARYLSLAHPAFVVQVLRWFLQLLCTGAICWLALLHLRHGTTPSPWLIAVPLASATPRPCATSPCAATTKHPPTSSPPGC